MARQYVPIFFDWLENTQDLDAEEKGHLIDAVIMYASGSDEWMDQLQTSGERIAFRFMRGQIDRNTEISEARSRAGASKKEQNETNENKPEQPETKSPKEKEKEKEKQKENKNKSVTRETVESFEAFWKEYPNKKAKPDAIKAWRKLNPDEELAGRIMAGLSKWKTSDQWTRDDGRFIPYPATWLNSRRWEDEVSVATRRGQNATVPAQQYSQRDYSEPGRSLEDLMREMGEGVMTG